MSEVKELNDNELNSVNGGTYEYVHSASVAINELFTNVLNSTQSKEDYDNAKTMAYGVLFAYKNLGFIDQLEYDSLAASIESTYKSFVSMASI